MQRRINKRRARLAWSSALMLVLSVVSAVGLSAIDAQTAAAAPLGCGYANSSANNGEFASTICWFDFTAFDMTQARSAPGQTMQVTLDGGYVATFTIHFSDVAGTAPMSVERRATPLETRFAFGTDAYRGVPGLHTLYSLPSPAGTKGGRLSFEDIQIVDALGAPVTGFSFVAADTEDNVAVESFAWSSDKPLNEIERLAPAGGWGCKTPVGLGTTNVTCAGTGVGATTIAGGKSTALLVAANSPTTFSTQWITPARSGIAIGIQTAKVTVVKQVASRIDPADSFTVAVAGTAGSVIGSADTGASNSATTGALNVLAGAQFTLSDAATAGSPTDLSNYDSTWACTNASATSTTVLPTGAGASKTVTPVAGDDITCTVTNTARVGQLTLTKSAALAGAGIAGDLVTYSFLVTNVGTATVSALHIDETAFTGTGSIGAVNCPTTTLLPAAATTCTATYSLTQADVDAGLVDNTAVAMADPAGPVVSVQSNTSTATVTMSRTASIGLDKSVTPTSANTGGTVTYRFLVTNTGSVTLNAVTITETAFSGSGPVPAATCPAGALAPAASISCTANYTITPSDARAGTITNTATASADAPVGVVDPVSAASSAALLAAPLPPTGPLALTGTRLAWSGVSLAGVLIIAGGALLLFRRQGARSARP